MRRLLQVLTVLILSLSLQAYEGAAATPTPTPAPEAHKIEVNGQSFFLKNTTRSDSGEIEEYGLEGETGDAWTQTLTLQRLSLAKAVSVDAFVAALRKQLEQSGDARFKLVQQGARASVFGVHYRQKDTSPEQVGLVLVLQPDSTAPQKLEIVQYMANPRRFEIETLATLMQRWQVRFQSQASAVSK